jgi:hypothetical protein
MQGTLFGYTYATNYFFGLTNVSKFMHWFCYAWRCKMTNSYYYTQDIISNYIHEFIRRIDKMPCN